MNIKYCDFCDVPLKFDDFYILYLAYSKTNTPPHDMEDYERYLRHIEKETKEICPSCKTLIDEVFRLRLNNLKELKNELLGIYETPTRPNPKERKNDKEKK